MKREFAIESNRKRKLIYSILGLLIVDALIVGLMFLYPFSLNAIIDFSIVYLIFSIYLIYSDRKFELQKDWIHFFVMSVILAAYSIGSVQEEPMYGNLLSLILLLGYPCWMLISIVGKDEEQNFSEKQLLIYLSTIVFILFLIRGIGYIWDGESISVASSQVLQERVLQLIFVLLILHYFVEKPISSPRDPIHIAIDDHSEKSELWTTMAKRVEETIFETDYYLYSGITLESMAHRSGYSSQELSQYLNGYYQKNFYQVIGERRIQYAMDLLRKEDFLTMDAISDQCGFNSKSTFYKYFKAYTGATPAAFVSMLNISKSEV